MRNYLIFFAISLMLVAAPPVSAAAPTSSDSPWYSIDAEGRARVDLYFFWSKTCPHCKEALPLVERLDREVRWVRVHSLELTEHHDNVRQYVQMAAELGQEASAVPGFLFCEQMIVGFDPGVEALLTEGLQGCRAHLEEQGTLEGFASAAAPARAERFAVALPLLGTVEFDELSLPVLTLAIAGLDAFNPCAFFVLLFLLSFLVNAQSRLRMAVVGGTFVFFSGLLYFLFMSAWLNLYLVIGHLTAITLTAGLLAVVVALLNIKDYFWFKQGVSLSIPDRARPRLFERMRGLIGDARMVPLLIGACGLALVANLYEFLCTAGFPMVFTRILTLREVNTENYYLYLLLYNLVYVIPLAVIVLVFTVTLGRRKLKESEGRLLKLLSGIMMLFLGVTLVFAPELLTQAWLALVLLIAALIATLLIRTVDRAVRAG